MKNVLALLTLVLAFNATAAHHKTRYVAIVNKPFAADFSKLFNYPTGTSFTVTKVSGPAWLNVSAVGAASGTPVAADMGRSRFGIAASSGASDTGQTFVITIHVRRKLFPTMACENGEEATFLGKSDEGDADVFACPAD